MTRVIRGEQKQKRLNDKQNPGETHAINVNKREPELAKTRASLYKARNREYARNNCRHAHAAKGTHQAPLTLLTEAAHARSSNRRACKQCRSV